MDTHSAIANRIGATKAVIADAPRPLAASPRGLACRLNISVCDRLADVEDFWRALQGQGTATVYQRYEWVQSSLATLERDESRRAFIVTGTLDGVPAMLLPLSIKGNFVRELCWVGGSHANFNMGLFSKTFLELIGPDDMRLIMNRIAKLVPGVGYVRLCLQPESWNGIVNPMTSLPHQRSVNPSFIIHLDGGFDAVLARGNAKRKRKKFRSQQRTAEEAGGYRLVVAEQDGEIDRLLEAFFQQKSERLAEQGIHNVFGSASARNFIADLAHRSIGTKEPLLRLYALEIGGKIRAVFGAGIHNGHMSGYFNSIANDEMTRMSPGEMLLYLVVEQVAAEGLKAIDLGAGEERYKRSWCDECLEMFDIILPTSSFGVPFALTQRLIHGTKRSIRRNPDLWSKVVWLRQFRGLIRPHQTHQG